MVAGFENVPAMPRPDSEGETSCAAIGPCLSAYADGEISAADRPIVDAHLERCEYCRFDLAVFELLDAAAPGMPVPELAEECFEVALDSLRRRMGRDAAGGAAVAASGAGDAGDAGNAGGDRMAAGVATGAGSGVPLSLSAAEEAAGAFPVPMVSGERWARVWSNVALRTVAASKGRVAIPEGQAASAGGGVAALGSGARLPEEGVEVPMAGGEQRMPPVVRPGTDAGASGIGIPGPETGAAVRGSVPRDSEVAGPTVRRRIASRWWVAAGLLAAACAAISLSLLPPPPDSGAAKSPSAESFDEDEAEAVSPRYQLIVRHLGRDDPEGNRPAVVCFVLKQ